MADQIDKYDVTIVAVVRQKRIPPSMEELCAWIPEIKSTSTMHERVKRLVTLGYLNTASTPEAVKNRTVTVTDKGKELFPEFMVTDRKGNLIT
jgi:DNA-binding HxlR family transcriptional regulator